jgi:hypothetical protein
MNLFCLIVALATSITDGRISSSSSSSSSQPVDGSAVDVNPNRRVLEPAGVDSETQYCMATPVGKQRGVVDWQEHDQCKLCEIGQKYWPCDGDILCEGQCTPEDVCDKRIQVAIDDLQQDTDAPSSGPSTSALTDSDPSSQPSTVPSSAPSLEPSTMPSNVPTETPSTSFTINYASAPTVTKAEIEEGKPKPIRFASEHCLFHSYQLLLTNYLLVLSSFSCC